MLTDLRYAVRLLLKDRSFTLTAVLTLAICLGANTAVFSIVRSIILKPLPVPNADRIMLVYNSYPNAGAEHGSAGVPDYFDRVNGVKAFAQQALYRRRGITLGDANGAQRLQTVMATPSFYRLLGVRPSAGRVFTDEEGEIGHEHEALLSYGFWQRHTAGIRRS